MVGYVLLYQTNDNFFRVTGTCMFPDTPLLLAAPCDIHRTFRTRARESCEVITAAPFTSKMMFGVKLSLCKVVNCLSKQ